MQKGLIQHDFFLFNGVSALGAENRNPANSLWYCENCRFEGGQLSNRQGFQAFGTEFSSGTNIKGLLTYERYPSGVAEEYLIAYYNSLFERVDVDAVTSTQITPTGWTGGDISVEGVSYRGIMYLCNGVDLIGKIDNVTWSTVTDSPRAQLLETWVEKLWAVDNTSPATVQYSRTATAANPAYIEDWTTVGAAGAELIGSGGMNTAMRRLDTKLYVFKQNYIEEFYDIDVSGTTPLVLHRPISETVGAINQRTTIVVENDIWFVMPNLEIRSLGAEANYSQSTPRTKDMSSIINRYKNSLDSDQSSACATYHKGIFKLSLKSKGSSQNDIKFIYDTNTGNWGFDKDTSQIAYTEVKGELYFCVDGNSGQVYKDNTGYSDNGFPMGWSAITGLVDDGRPDLAKYARYIFIRGKRSEDTTIYAYLLGEDRVRLETFTIPVPTAAEIAAASVTIEDTAKQVGDDQVGNQGYNGTEEDLPLAYRFDCTFSCSSTDRLFGVEFESSLNGQRAIIDEVKLKYIPRGEGYYPITA